MARTNTRSGPAMARLRWLWRPIVATAGGWLAGLALAPANFWPAIIASVVLIHLSVRRLGFWPAAAVGLPAGIAFYASQSAWMSRYLGPEPWLALAVLEGLVFAGGIGLAAGVWTWLLRHRTRLGARYYLLVSIWLPLIWVAREWVSGHWPYGGYQWSRLGQSVANTGLSHLAYWGGISMVSLGVAAIAVGAILLVEALIHGRTPRNILAAAAAAVVLVALSGSTSWVWNLDNQHKRHINVLAVQGNANAGLFANPVPGSILAKHLQATNDYLNRHPHARFDLIVWPENSSDVDPFQNGLAQISIRSVVARTHSPLLVGSVIQRGERIFNTGLLYLPNRAEPIEYDKRRPVPFGEYVPNREFWRALAPDLIDLISRGYAFGQRSGVMPVAGTKLGDLICFEIGIDSISHDLVSGGAQFIVSQANNSDFGHTAESFQQEALIRLQAIATGRSIIHASTVATTEIVSPHGRILAGTKAFQPGVAAAAIPLETSITPAMKFFGWLDWFALTVAILGGLILIDLRILRFISVRSQPKNLESFEVDRKAVLNTLVIMPTYNEAENITRIASHLLATVPEVDLLIVDDNSPDGTGRIADDMAAANSRVHVLHRTEKNGLGPAYLAGFAWGFERGYEYLVEMDADGSHRAEDLNQMLAVADKNDLVIGSRWVKGGRVVNWPLSRQIISRVGNTYARFMLRAGVRDITAGFRVFRASFLKSLDLSSIASAGYSFQVEMAWRCFRANARIQEVPITFVEREIGYSKMSKKIVFEALWRVTRWGFERF